MARRPGKVYCITLKDEENGDLIIRLRGTTVGRILDSADMESSGDKMAKIRHIIGLLETQMIEWNLEDENGVVMPITESSIRTLGPEDLIDIYAAWMSAIKGVPAPLEQQSGSGVPFPEASIPMAPLSPSPTN